MSEKPPRDEETGKVIHLGRPRKPLSQREEIMREVDESLAAHFREQNQMLMQHNREQAERLREQGERLRQQSEMVERLTVGVERLVTEMHGVRTGRKEEAFARVGGVDASPDLPTVSTDSAIHYCHTSKTIGLELGFHPSQVGQLLGPKGLGWAGNGDYQEIGRQTGPGGTKFWHREVPARLRKVLDENEPDRHGIRARAVLTIFRRWQERKGSPANARDADGSGTAH